MSDLLMTTSGSYGSDPIDDTNDHVAGAGSYTGVREWIAFVWAETGAFAANTAVTKGSVSTSITYPAGYVAYGPFTTIDLASGSGEAIRSTPKTYP